MKVIMTGGGTGGHIYPAIAIADKIRRKNPEAEILFVGTQRGMEKDLVPKAGYAIEFIEVTGFNRKNLLKNIKTLQILFKGIRQSKDIIDRFKPDLVIGTGGYVCGPMVRAAHKKGIKTYIHEQNALPGLTNKMLEKHADKIFISFEDSKKYFKNPTKLILSGNPVRKEFLVCSIHNNREKIGLADTDFMVLCIGGSQGSETLNKAIMASIAQISQDSQIRMFFVTGTRHYSQVKETLEAMGISTGEYIQILDYLTNMPEYLSAADLVVSRAGALAVSEINACGKASILVPSPYVADNHQYYNAKVSADAGAAIIIEEKDLTAEKLSAAIMRLKNNKAFLNRMSQKSEELGRLDAVEIIYENLDI